jgi:hypothetical protein
MIDRPHAPITGVAIRLGRTELGQGTVTIDDDTLMITVRDDAGERPIRLRLVAIDSAALAEEEVTISLRDGKRLTLRSPAAGELREVILAHCRVLPELTHALRAFGSRRDLAPTGRRAQRNSNASSRRCSMRAAKRFAPPIRRARSKRSMQRASVERSRKRFRSSPSSGTEATERPAARSRRSSSAERAFATAFERLREAAECG